MSVSRRRGITLAEVLVATVVIALLLALLIPVGLSVKASAEQTACASAARQNGTAVLMYSQDYDGVYPLHDQSNVRDNPGRGRAGAVVEQWSTTRVPNWSAGAINYARSRSVAACNSSLGWADGVDKAQPPLSFIFNGWAVGRPQADATTPASLVMLYDCRYQTSWSTANPSAVQLRGGRGRGNGNSQGPPTFPDPNGTYFDAWNDTNAPPHRVDGKGGRYNVIFLDGHLQSMDAEALQSHARYKSHKPPKGLVPPIPQNHFAF